MSGTFNASPLRHWKASGFGPQRAAQVWISRAMTQLEDTQELVRYRAVKDIESELLALASAIASHREDQVSVVQVYVSDLVAVMRTLPQRYISLNTDEHAAVYPSESPTAFELLEMAHHSLKLWLLTLEELDWRGPWGLTLRERATFEGGVE